MVAEFLVGRRPDAADGAARQSRFEQVRRIHRAAAGCASADDGVDFINEQDRVGQLFKLRYHGLQPFFKVTAVARACKQGAHVERVDDGGQQYFGNLLFDDAPRKSFGNGGFADAGLTHIKRVVLRPAAQDLHRAVDLGRASDQRIDAALLCLFVQIDGELVKRAFFLVLLGLAFLWFFTLLLAALHLARFGQLAVLANAVADIGYRVEAAHILLLQEVDGVAFPFGKERDEHIRAGHNILAGALDVQNRPLHHPLETAGGGGVNLAFDAQALELAVEIGDDDVGQFTEIDTAGLHHLGGIGIVDQRKQKMLQSRIFMGAVACMLERVVERCFQRFRK